ncbi:MAG: efflux transporter outer membrane subunit [Filimonas sp.]|nr:efflux transporter outer membrane subunit [Filimonas sp.]
MRRIVYLPYFFILSSAACMLYGCSVTKPYKNDQQPSANLYRDSLPVDSSNMATLPLSDIFRDTILLRLIKEGIQNNLNLKTAIANIKIAEANYTQAQLAFYPSLSVAAQGGVYRPSNEQASNTTLYQLYATSSWQADIWGQLKSSKKALYASLLQSDAYKQAVQTQLVADIAGTYYALMAYDAQLAIAQTSVEKYAKDVETMKILKNSDVVTGAAVVQSAANYYSVSATIPDIKNNIRMAENTLSLLLARPPGTIARDSIFNEQEYASMKIGVPAQLLANRPDVREAELQLRSTFELTNVARTYFYPTITITGEAGLYSTNLSVFFKPGAFFANLVGGITQPIFNKGLNKQRLKTAEANYEVAQYNFSQSLLTAGQEVSNALYQYQMANEKAGSRKEQIANLEKAVFFTSELLKYTANTNYTDVLTSEQNLLSAKLSAVNDKLQQLQAIVNLYAALGGGWQ